METAPTLTPQVDDEPWEDDPAHAADKERLTPARQPEDEELDEDDKQEESLTPARKHEEGQDDLLGEQLPPATEKPKRRRREAEAETGTVYVVWEKRTFIADDGDLAVDAWVEVGSERASNGRTAIVAVVGDRAGSFKAVPESSNRTHVRREEIRLMWDDEGGD